MPKQLTIDFPKYQFNMDELKKTQLLNERVKLEEELKHLKYSIRTHKGHYTKLKNKKNN
jgi:hypothetical protein